MTRSAPTVTALAAACFVLTACRGGARTVIRNWPSDRPVADTVAHSMALVIGAAPTLLAACGPHHVLIGYADAPVDIRPEQRPGTDGQAELVISAAQRSRYSVAAVIALAFWSAMPFGVYDTVTVRLSRTKHFPPGFSDRNEFTLAPITDVGHPLVAQPVWGQAEACVPVI